MFFVVFIQIVHCPNTRTAEDNYYQEQSHISSDFVDAHLSNSLILLLIFVRKNKVKIRKNTNPEETSKNSIEKLWLKLLNNQLVSELNIAEVIVISNLKTPISSLSLSLVFINGEEGLWAVETNLT